MTKHVPERTCVICRSKKPRHLLLRYTCPEDGQDQLMPDPDKIAQGRGFYTCADTECAEKIIKFRGWIHKCKGVEKNV
ncbi:YlxR family protein [Desulfonatronovibrio magnus]|uniref:YlxR family protein n=1 Tax=Desulfonatronovibrio magnus TaxID=698827 RepID=UPI0005EAE2ED|nr:DUF448 domain-containing protein [Desulfonatronovibrio magnus]